ncbi:MAG: L,D-transpeptidase family protein [Anaerolineaceae bacterium]
MNININISRRDFLKMTGLAAGSLLLPFGKVSGISLQQDWKVGANLGRLCIGELRSFQDFKSEPNWNAPTTERIWRDDVFEIKQEVIANVLDYNRYNQKWYETPHGFIYSPYVQPVKYLPNEPLNELPVDDQGQIGMWVEISVPRADFELTKPWSQASSWIRDSEGQAKLYYSQIFWASDIRSKAGNTEYLLSEKYGALPDYYWVDARACRPITAEEISPIHPEVGDKHVLVNLQTQTLHCFEGPYEVYFCEVSTGYIRDGKWLTPPETTPVWRKMISLHMSAGGVSQYDSPGIAWTTLYHPDGQAIHSVYWHNNFGVALSHGCINCMPEDAKWIWRWTNPTVGLYPGEMTVSDSSQSTYIQVIES